MSVSFIAAKGFLMAEIKASMSPVYAFIVLGDLFSPLRYSSYFFVVLASFQPVSVRAISDPLGILPSENLGA
jgi:hypothetical protein